ncbi:MAG: hypothetical protein U1F35_11840 [Steroidobacteraceae bacterium]
MKMRVRAPGGVIDAIQFGYLGGPFDDARVRPGARLRLLYRLEVNEYEGRERLQMNCACLLPV